MNEASEYTTVHWRSNCCEEDRTWTVRMRLSGCRGSFTVVDFTVVDYNLCATAQRPRKAALKKTQLKKVGHDCNKRATETFECARTTVSATAFAHPDSMQPKPACIVRSRSLHGSTNSGFAVANSASLFSFLFLRPRDATQTGCQAQTWSLIRKLWANRTGETGETGECPRRPARMLKLS